MWYFTTCITIWPWRGNLQNNLNYHVTKVSCTWQNIRPKNLELDCQLSQAVVTRCRQRKCGYPWSPRPCSSSWLQLLSAVERNHVRIILTVLTFVQNIGEEKSPIFIHRKNRKANFRCIFFLLLITGQANPDELTFKIPGEKSRKTHTANIKLPAVREKYFLNHNFVSDVL